jgi:predicted Zn-dependent protease
MLSYRQVADSAGLSIWCGPSCACRMSTPREAASEFGKQLRDKKYVSELATRYGAWRTHCCRSKDLAAAQKELDALMALKVSSPMIAGLAGEIRKSPRPMIKLAPLAIYRDALQRYPQSRALVYGYAEALLAGAPKRTEPAFSGLAAAGLQLGLQAVWLAGEDLRGAW